MHGGVDHTSAFAITATSLILPEQDRMWTVGQALAHERFWQFATTDSRVSSFARTGIVAEDKKRMRIVVQAVARYFLCCTNKVQHAKLRQPPCPMSNCRKVRESLLLYHSYYRCSCPRDQWQTRRLLRRWLKPDRTAQNIQTRSTKTAPNSHRRKDFCWKIWAIGFWPTLKSTLLIVLLDERRKREKQTKKSRVPNVDSLDQYRNWGFTRIILRAW